MNLSGIPKPSLLGRLLRYPLRFIPTKTVVPILQGRLRGKKWIVGSSNHGYWLGSYEFYKRDVFEQTITAGSVVWRRRWRGSAGWCSPSSRCRKICCTSKRTSG